MFKHYVWAHKFNSWGVLGMELQGIIMVSLHLTYWWAQDFLLVASFNVYILSNYLWSIILPTHLQIKKHLIFIIASYACVAMCMWGQVPKEARRGCLSNLELENDGYGLPDMGARAFSPASSTNLSRSPKLSYFHHRQSLVVKRPYYF